MLAALAGLLLITSTPCRAEEPPTSAAPAATAADEIANIFSQVGDQIYEDCIFDLSQEQIEVQAALIEAYIEKGADGAAARRLAVNQIQAPKVSEKCEKIRSSAAITSSWVTTLTEPKAPPVTAPPEPATKPLAVTAPPEPTTKPAAKPAAKPEPPAAPITLAGKTGLPHWDCAPGVDYVTIRINGYERKLTGGEICNPYQDIVREVPSSAPSFRLGYTISTGRLFVVSDDPQTNGQTIAWAISGRDICRNNPDPDCLATRAVGSLPPGEYSFSANKAQRITWGPKTKRYVAGVYLRKLWNKDQFSKQQRTAMLARGNIAIHARLKGEMSEACIGLEPKGWAYVASLIKENRATGLNAYLYEPYPQVAEAPPVIVASTFSFTSLFK